MRVRLLGLILVAALCCCSSSKSADPTLSGTLAVPGCDSRWAYSFETIPGGVIDKAPTAPCATDGDACTSDGIFNYAGSASEAVTFPGRAQVIVKDAADNKLIAVGSIGDGKWIYTGDLPERHACQLSFTVPRVPAAKFYNIEIGPTKWGVLSDADLKAKNYRLDLRAPSSNR